MKLKNSNHFLPGIEITLCMILAVGCSSNTKSIPQSDFILVDDDQLVMTNLDGDTMTVIEKRERPKGDSGLWYYSEKIFEDPENWYVKTSTDNNMGVWIEAISKSDLSVKRTKFSGIDINVLAFDGDQIIASNNKMNELCFEIYDKNLNHLETKTLNYRNGEARIMLETKLLPTEDGRYYLLLGFIPEGSDYAYNENHLLELDHDFNVVHDLDFGLYDGSLSSFCIVGSKIFANINKQGIGSDGRGLKAQTVLVYDLDSGASTGQKIDLDVSSGGSLSYDSVSGNVVLQRTLANDGETDFFNIPAVLINTDNYTATDLVLPDSVVPVTEGRPPFTFVKNGQFCYLTPMQLVIWDLITLETNVYSLEGISEDGNGIFIPDQNG